MLRSIEIIKIIDTINIFSWFLASNSPKKRDIFQDKAICIFEPNLQQD